MFSFLSACDVSHRITEKKIQCRNTFDEKIFLLKQKLAISRSGFDYYLSQLLDFSRLNLF